ALAYIRRDDHTPLAILAADLVRRGHELETGNLRQRHVVGSSTVADIGSVRAIDMQRQACESSQVAALVLRQAHDDFEAPIAGKHQARALAADGGCDKVLYVSDIQAITR